MKTNISGWQTFLGAETRNEHTANVEREIELHYLMNGQLVPGGQDQDGDASDPGEELPPRQSDIAGGVNDWEEHELEELVKLLGAEIKCWEYLIGMI